MANTAFTHDPTITVPGSSTANAIVTWNGTTGKSFSNSTIIVGATTMGLAADTDLLTFGNGTLAITGTVTGISTITATTFSGALSGNATSATSAATLTTARAIGGVNFNGSAAIDLPGVNTAGNQNTTGSAATLTTARAIGGVNFNGSAAITLPGVNSAGDQNTSGTAAGLSTALVVASGGTNTTSYTKGDVLIASAGTTLTKLGIGSNTHVLTADSNEATGVKWAAGGGGNSFTNDVTITSGNLVMATSGKGIDFSATTDYGTTTPSELLDDYEEGTWTPTFIFSGSGSLSYSQQVGTYTKIGNAVTVSFRVALNASVPNTFSGHAGIGGLPFTTHGTARGAMSIGYVIGITCTGTMLMIADLNASVFMLYESSDNALTPTISMGNFVSTSPAIVGGGVYHD